MVVQVAGMKAWWAILALVLAVGLGGCVEREITVRSEPPGAIVLLSDVEVGRTPLTIPFTWYGDYDIILRLAGHKTLKTHANLRPPIYEIPPLDFFSAIAPWTYHDRRYLHYTLTKLSPPDEEALLERAEELRRRTLEPVAP